MTAEFPGWDRLRHAGLLLDAQRLRQVAAQTPPPLGLFHERELRRQAGALVDDSADASGFVAFVLQDICGFTASNGAWQRGSNVPTEWGRASVTGETVKPRQLWQGNVGGLLPVFLDREKRVGIGRGRKATSQVLQWLRAGSERLALLTNDRQWRLVFAGLDFDAWCEWDVDLWFEEGALSPQIDALRTLFSPTLWTPLTPAAPAPLLEAILDSRKGQAELSAVLGERVREAVELLLQSHGEVLKEQCTGIDPADIYRAAVRMVMRLVVILFAESRELLPRDNALYHSAYGINGLLEELEKAAARGGNRLARSWNAWPRALALFRLVYQGSHHPELPVPAYGGDLFAPGDAASVDGLVRAVAVFESACFDHELLSDRDVYRMLERITRTRVKLRQGRASTWVPSPVDFSDLSSEYIGILYEGLLDFELKTAPAGDPVVFLAVGNQPALPLSRLEAMDDKALTGLLEKMKDTSKGDAEEEGEEAEPTDESDTEDERPDGEEEDDALAAESEEVEPGDGDERHVTRTRAETWARRAVEVGKLVRKPRGTLTPEKRLAYEDAVARSARQLVARVLLPGEWYLVRWGGTRKGSGTFYTRPGLAVPTVHRTLRPLAYTPPAAADGSPDLNAPPAAWIPKTPEEILALKICDPASGSGTFPVATLRFLTEALYASLHYHGRISEDGDRAVVRLLAGAPARAGAPEERLGQELLPCRPDDPLFEPRLKAILRRHVVERCIYGVDLDPLAVELCRLSLWIETMDRTLPFSFLDHKIKCGNALTGAWFDQFQHYPVMAWKNREGGDKGHSNGVHFEKEVHTKAIKAFVKDQLAPDLRRFLEGRTLFSQDLQQQAAGVHTAALTTLARLHDLPVQDSAERARIYREELVGSEAYRSLKAAMDLWCACWFWPADALEHAPLPTTLAAPSEQTRAIAEQVAPRKRFFHWELEFPDVFRTADSGFDAMQGNPPWDIAKPNSKEFFSNIDPLYRSYGKQEALRHQSEHFADAEVERAWLDYNADFHAQSNYMGYAASPFGDPAENDKSQDRFGIARGKENDAIHLRWRAARAKGRGFADSAHPFRHQGSADINLYKAFLEQVHALLRPGGRLGFIVPSGLYSDHGSGGLRQLFLDHCRWEWLFGFENRDKVFEIDSRFKFNPVIIEKGGKTEAIRTAFMRRKLEDWADAKGGLAYPAERIHAFSPKSLSVVEIQSDRDLSTLSRMHSEHPSFGSQSPSSWAFRYSREFHMGDDVGRFLPVGWFRERGYEETPEGLWRHGEGTAMPFLEGRCIDQFQCFAKRWISGKGRGAIWEPALPEAGGTGTQYLMATDQFSTSEQFRPGPKIAVMDVTSATNERTVICAVVPPCPTGHSITTLQPASTDLLDTLAASAILNSMMLDYTVRLRLGGNHLSGFAIEDVPIPLASICRQPLAWLTLRLNGCHAMFSPMWLEARSLLASRPLGDCRWAIALHERLRIRCALDGIVAALYGLSREDIYWILRNCDQPREQLADKVFCRTLDPKGFWRVDKEKDPELRHTVLTLVAFHDLEAQIRDCGGDSDKGIEAFFAQNDGEGWMLPETLRLADYGLGHDERAKHPQPVASRLGPRFYDWQLAQSAEESWRECHLHARNLLGEAGYRKLLADIEAEKRGDKLAPITLVLPPGTDDRQRKLFE